MDNNKQSNIYLKELVNFSVEIDSLNKNLTIVDWDYQPENEIYIKISDIQSVLERHYNEEISISDLVDWANLVEGRESLTYLDEESDLINNLISYIANPEINYSLDKDVINSILLCK